MNNRVAFTIIFNGEHHLKHNNHVEELLPYFDKWVFAEGFSLPTGSTSWCKNVIDECSHNGSSIDGTLEYLEYLKDRYPDKVIILKSDIGYWNGKDVQVNACLEELRKHTSYPTYLWEFDSDEHWSIDNIMYAEDKLKSTNTTALDCKCNVYVGNNLITRGGNWGSDTSWIRLWVWGGEPFRCHEPPRLNRHEHVLTLNEYLFEHYSYYFEQDVIFKSKYYGGHEKVYENWIKINELQDNQFPISIYTLFGNDGYYGDIIKGVTNDN